MIERLEDAELKRLLHVLRTGRRLLEFMDDKDDEVREQKVALDEQIAVVRRHLEDRR